MNLMEIGCKPIVGVRGTINLVFQLRPAFFVRRKSTRSIVLIFSFNSQITIYQAALDALFVSNSGVSTLCVKSALIYGALLIPNNSLRVKSPKADNNLPKEPPGASPDHVHS